jgi:hypothetical protein
MFIMGVKDLKVVDFIADIQPITEVKIKEYLVRARWKEQKHCGDKQTVELWVRKRPYFKNPELVQFIKRLQINVNDLTGGAVKFGALTKSFIKIFKHRYVMPCFPDDHNNILAKLPEWIENYNQLTDEGFNDK